MNRWKTSALSAIIGACIVAAWTLTGNHEDDHPEIPYSEAKQAIDTNAVTAIVMTSELLTLTFTDGVVRIARRPPDDEHLYDLLDARGVRYEMEKTNSITGKDILSYTITLLTILVTLYLIWSIRRATTEHRGGWKPTESRTAQRTTFADVAGCDEAKMELAETVAFLRDPKRFTRLGARAPRGVLLFGPPGTGKTLLARAVAGEAGVPFFSLSGSELMEVFVGTGPARVRSLFRDAGKQAPAIIFIDEIDAIGGKREGSARGGDQERHQTLNQILVGMDGFDQSSGLTIIAATNRRETLDPALLRPGRFDRHVVIDLPDTDGRAHILELHAAYVQTAPDLDLRTIAQQTAGMSGADLANVVNESAIIATRSHEEHVTTAHMLAAIDRVLGGLERKTRRLNDAERTRVAIHEAGHAIVRAAHEGAASVRKISIIPRGEALGYNILVPPEDRYLFTEDELLGHIAGLFGGRAAEALVLGDISTGAADDLARATSIARRYVTQFGMSTVLPHLAFETADDDGEFRATMATSPNQRERVDAEVERIRTTQYARATAILTEHRERLDALAAELLTQETLTGDRLHALLDGIRPQHQTNGADGSAGLTHAIALA